ncbi:D-ribose pyranase [Paenibacillus flagellatus]|uniref:D-ribose pyranase n=1 Tax=Paenibacillus flagellatus TaxID=2211139 RepID=A0A2V5KAL9_9BACL|nr:D-ribose pyranase [Paenibacillus flagellatus]PYI55144.1 D-ribose pyranase [Paenibacillus flagellatus]
MKKSGILNPSLCRLLAETGHTDMITICDRGFPVPAGPERLDLALVDDVPTVLDVLSAIDREFVIDRIIVAEEMAEASPERYAKLLADYPHIAFMQVPHVRFKHICPESRAVVRTGDSAPYANIIIVSG